MWPRRHGFRHRVYYVLADVDRLVGRRRSPRIGARDLGHAGGTRRFVEDHLATHGLPVPERILVLAQPRWWGVGFNPVVFYFALRGERIEAVVAEITNTPWGERHSYVLDARGGPGNGGEFVFEKTFHVSPFNPMDLEYRWRFAVDDDRIGIGMWLARGGRNVMFAGLRLDVRPLDGGARLRAALRYPVQGAITLLRIYWHAFRLWLKRVPVHPHPGSGEKQPPRQARIA